MLLHLPSAADGRLLLSSTLPLGLGAPEAALGAGFWEELSPGIRSLRLGSEEPRGGGRVQARLETHAWADPWTRRLARFDRDEWLWAEAEAQGARRGCSPDVAALLASGLWLLGHSRLSRAAIERRSSSGPQRVSAVFCFSFSMRKA